MYKNKDSYKQDTGKWEILKNNFPKRLRDFLSTKRVTQ